MVVFGVVKWDVVVEFAVVVCDVSVDVWLIVCDCVPVPVPVLCGSEEMMIDVVDVVPL